MEAREWREVKALFDALVELPPAARAERLAALSVADPGLRDAVAALLDADGNAGSRLLEMDAAFLLPSESPAPIPLPDPFGLSGRTLAHFRVVEPLGAGGMGVVYRAEDTRLHRLVALKVPLLQHRLDTSAKQRFLQEARSTAALDHPNLCGIYEVGESEEGHPFLAMPLYPGETLKQRLAREGPLPVEEAVEIARQVAEGLAHAHAARIVHRDVKPGNVMLLPGGAVKILDFGLAKVRDLTLTGSRTQLGTVAYMAPEQIRHETVDGRADLWALGVVLYEMLTGRRPFEGEHEVSVAHAIVHEEPVRPSALRREIPPSLERLLFTLLHKDPVKRYASAERLATMLDSLKADTGEPAVSVWRRAATRFRPGARRVRSALLLASLLAAGALAAWLGGSTTAAPAHHGVAVLPFDHPADDPDHYLAIGLSDALSTELSRVSGLVVPGIYSTAGYGGTLKPLSLVARELQVSAVLVGSVQRVEDRLQLELRLFDANRGEWLWSQRYERPSGALPDLVPDALASILAALDLESQVPAIRPLTTNARAYDLYLQGRAVELSHLPLPFTEPLPNEDIRRVQALFARARDLDPNFALARAYLAQRLMTGAEAYDTTQARRDHARLEAEAALRLVPGLTEAHQAMAWYWAWGGTDMAKAIQEMERAIERRPRSAELRLWLAKIYLRSGRLEDAVVELDQARRLEPRNAAAHRDAAVVLLRLRRDEEAIRALNQALELMPHDHLLSAIKGDVYLKRQGTPDTLAAVLRNIPPEWDPRGMATWARYTMLRVQRQPAEALAMLDASASELSRDAYVYQPTALMRAPLYEALGEHAKARADYARARDILADSARAHPEKANIRAALGLAYAGLGMKREAIESAQRAIELTSLSRDNRAATAMLGNAVEVFGRVGALDEAFNRLELLLQMPAGREITVPFLRVWPGFDPLRGDPRYERLLEQYGAD